MSVKQQPDNRTLVKRLLRMPGTRAGWGAIALLGLHLVFMLIWRAHLWTRLVSRQGTGFFANPLHAATILAADATAVAAGLLALFALSRRGERSLMLIAVEVYALFVAAFALGEVLFPH